MTDTMFTHTALTEAAKKAEVTTAQARTILEAAGVTVQPEKPALPTEPGSVVIATELRGVEGRWQMMLDDDGDWSSGERVRGHRWHRPNHITAWIETVVLPVTAAPVTLTEDQVGEFHEVARLKNPAGAGVIPFSRLSEAVREIHTATVNAALAQYAAPVEGEPIADAAKLIASAAKPIASAAKPIDPADVREGDRVRVVMDSGDEATVTVTSVSTISLGSRLYGLLIDDIRAVYLLHREEA